MNDGGMITCPHCGAEIRRNTPRCYLCWGELANDGLGPHRTSGRIATLLSDIVSVILALCLLALASIVAFGIMCFAVSS
jgi:hypothetical protein